jgi:multicomponent Na+:H+ antiporter subunit A
MSTPILETGTRAVFHTILLFSIFMLFAGHNAPGGGFIGGLIAVAAFVLRATAEGVEDIEALVRVRAESLLGIGVLLAALTGLAGFAINGSFLGGGSVTVPLGPIGEATVYSALFFDIGVYLLVLALGLILVRSLGGDVGMSDSGSASGSRPDMSDSGSASGSRPDMSDSGSASGTRHAGEVERG